MFSRVPTLISMAAMLAIAGCGVAADSTPPAPGASSATRTNLVLSVSGESGYGSEPGCMLHWTAENRQERNVTLMLGVALRDGRNGAELSNDQMTVAMGVPARGTANYPAYSLSGADCADLELEVTNLMCVGGDCAASYHSQDVAQLIVPSE